MFDIDWFDAELLRAGCPPCDERYPYWRPLGEDIGFALCERGKQAAADGEDGKGDWDVVLDCIDCIAGAEFADAAYDIDESVGIGQQLAAEFMGLA